MTSVLADTVLAVAINSVSATMSSTGKVIDT